MSSFDRRLAQTLTRSEAIPADRVRELMARATAAGESLFAAVCASGDLDEAALLGVIAHDCATAAIGLDRLSPDRDALDALHKDTSSKYGVLPVSKIGNVLTIAVSDPYALVELDHLKLLLKCELRIVVASARAMADAQRRFYSDDAEKLEALIGDAHAADDMVVREHGEDERDDLDISETGSETAPVIKLTNLIIANAIRDKVSDIHIEPYENRIRVRYRLDGVLKDVPSPPRSMGQSIVSRIKIMSSLDIAEKRRPQDGKFQVKIEGRSVDFRVSTLPVVHGEKVVMRILDTSNLALDLDTLGFEPKNLQDFRDAIAKPYGMILITGPTGSGKSTTLYSSVRELYSDEVNFVTVEDPVEYQLEGINQVPVNVKRGVTFAAALRSILRQDPDTILIGEIRDAETIEIAVKAALTGHLVLSTLHTNDAPGAISRMIDMGLDPFLVGTSVVLVAAQRLMRRLCSNCAEPIKVPKERLTSVGFHAEEVEEAELFRAVGCSRCHQGYKGRFAIIETLPITDAIKELILAGKSSIDIKKQSISEGMITLRRSAILNALRGHTSVEEVLRVTMSDDF